MNAWICCGQQTTNPQYCSRSCAAKHTNVLYPKRRQRKRFCKHCGTVIHLDGRRTVCLDCNPFHVDWEAITIAEMRGKRRYQKNSAIRDRARKQYICDNRPLRCYVCGYDKHVDICHIRALSDFPEETPLRVANAPENLAALCPNHHWEFDHRLLDIASLGFPEFDRLHLTRFHVRGPVQD